MLILKNMTSIKKFLRRLFERFVIREKLDVKEQFIVRPRGSFFEGPFDKKITYTSTRFFRRYVFNTKEKKAILRNMYGEMIIKRNMLGQTVVPMEFVQEDNILLIVENSRIKKFLTVVLTIPNASKPTRVLTEGQKKRLEYQKKRLESLSRLTGH